MNLITLAERMALAGVVIPLAAAFEWRKIRQYVGVVINICEKAEIKGDAARMLREEMLGTADYLKART